VFRVTVFHVIKVQAGRQMIDKKGLKKSASPGGKNGKAQPKDGKKEVTGEVKKSLGSLFGKVSGKDQLELEIDRLNSHLVEMEIDLKTMEIQLSKKEIMARDAVAAKQEAESRLNQELVKMQTLTHELETIRAEAPEKFEFRGIETLSPSAMEAYFSKLSSFRTPGENLLTVYLPPGTALSDVLSEKILSYLDEETHALLDRINPETGLVLFHDIHRMVSEAIVPSIPIMTSAWYFKDHFETGALEGNQEAECRILILLLHAGESFIGFAPDRLAFDAEELVRSSVKEKHSKGGFSQRRFERLREEDIAHHLAKVMETVNKILEENAPVDCVIMSGESQLLREVEKRLPLDIEVIEKSMDLKLEKISGDEVMRSVLSCRRYLL